MPLHEDIGGASSPPPPPLGFDTYCVERVGDEGFKKAPIGAGPYRFLSATPGVELVLEAFEGYWKKAHGVKRLVFKSIPDETTRAAALKRGEVDIAYALNGPVAPNARPALAARPNGLDKRPDV